MQEHMEKALDPQRAYVRVVDYIKQEIRNGNLKIGSKLPPERVLAEQLGVGRNSVREALRILEIIGATTSTQGAGHFISVKGMSFQQLSQLRYALEKQAFALTVANACEKDLDDLRAIVARLDRGVSEEENVLLDKQLHYTIARASGNMLFVDILNALSDVMDLFIADLRIDIMSETHRKEALFATHRRIVEAIVNKDLPSGFEAIDEHFALIDQRLRMRSLETP